MAASMTPENAFAHRERVQSRRLTYKSISGGTLLICIGVILLLNTTGRLSWGIWLDLALLWPILLISLGLRLLFTPTPLHILSLAGPAMVVAATIWAATGEAGRLWQWRQELTLNEPVTFACAPSDPERPGHLDLGFDAGTLRLVTTAADPQVKGFTGTMRWAGTEPRRGCGATGDLRLGRPDWDPGIHMAPPFTEVRHRWETELAASGRVDLDVRLAAADADLDLRRFDLIDLDVETAASNVVIHLGAPRGRVPVHIDGGVSRVELKLPEGTCFAVTRERVLGLLDVEDAREDSSRSHRLVAEACDPVAGDSLKAKELPRYEITFEVPISSVSIQPEPATL